ncbi:TonB-dependent receptor [Deminuibacter soli]|uniref:TonB-dependent receptor n=1 Tax=Deminuibacter soli TaxID=2291815 RepID=A0A3E1NJK8_9BACT|nr:TonB-dependent receptor [Deminuibacter soli]RFM28004.1 TonB-dependent receptor [Deminuibacter soli]
MRQLTILACLCFLPCLAAQLAAQIKYTLNGYIKDSLSGETLIGASISFEEGRKGVNANRYGFYSITLAAGEYQAVCSFIGYESKVFTIRVDSTRSLDILLSPLTTSMNNVTVIGKKKEDHLKTAQMGKIDLDMNAVKTLPVLLGETDILKTLQLMPGVRNAGEGNSGIYVRGGGPDQNLILLDEAVVYNSGHLFGFFSVFNSDAIKSVSLIKGGMPAQYGGRLSSVLDIAMKEGNLNKTEIDAGIGLIASRFTIQGPIKKQKASYMLSARRTYVDQLIKPFVSKQNSSYGSGYYFYDLNAKMNYIFSPRDRLYLSGYLGRDVFEYKNSRRSFSLRVPWGNATATARLNHVFSRKLFANLTLLYNDYKFSFDGGQNNFNLKLSSGIQDYAAKTDFDWYASTAHKVRFGAQYTYHTFRPNVASGSQDTTEFTPNNSVTKHAKEYAAYIQDDWDISKLLKLNVGVRYSVFHQVGPYTAYNRDADGNKLDSVQYGSGKLVKGYGGLEPRATLRFMLNNNSSVKLAVTRNLQYIHLVTNAGTTLPTDLWVPSTLHVKPQIGWQYAAGYFRNFNNNMFETSLELYYKTMQNQIEYREGYTPSLTDPEQEFVFGKGWSYGSELFVRKVKGRLTGWVGYTLSYSWRRFPDLNYGNKYPSKYDRRHDLSVVGMYELTKKWKLSSIFVYGSGNAMSLPERFYFINNVLTQQYSTINAYRAAAYHRLDFAATYTPVPKRKHKYTSSWVFSIYNVYSRANPYFYYYDQSGSISLNGRVVIKAKKVSLFPIIPAVTWNVHW